METIQVNVSPGLARRLQPYQDELSRLLEWGLRHAEETAAIRPKAKPGSNELAVQKQVIAALHQAGAIGPEPEVTAHYLAEREGRAWQPIAAAGKPASEMIVEERDNRTWARA